jgi:hypothetical protein
MLTKVNTSYLSFGENDLNEVLYLMQFKYYLEQFNITK